MQTMQVLLSVGPGGAWLVVFLHCQPGILPFSLPHHDTSLTPSSGPAAGLEERAQVLSSEWVAVLQAAGPCSLVLQRSLLAALPARLLEGKRHKPGVHESALWDFTSKLVFAFFKTSCVLVSWLTMNCSMLSLCWLAVLRRSAVPWRSRCCSETLARSSTSSLSTDSPALPGSTGLGELGKAARQNMERREAASSRVWCRALALLRSFWRPLQSSTSVP